MLAGVAVLPDLCKNLLHQDELIRHKREVLCKLTCAGISLDVQNRIGEGEQIPQYRVVLGIHLFQFMLGLVRLQQNTLLDNLISRGGRKGQSCLEAGLNPGEFIFTGFDDLINGFLPGAYHPDLAAAFAADLLHERLQVDQQVRVTADVLANLVNHEQQPEILRLRIHILFYLGNELGNGGLHSLGPIEPVAGSLLTHAEHFLQGGDNVILKEGIGIAGRKPARAVLLLEHTPELFGLALFGNELLQLGNFQVLAVEAEIVIEHLGENAQHGGFVLVDGPFDVDVKENRVGQASGGTVDEHEGGRVVRKLLAEPLHSLHALNFLVLQQVRQHFQKVRFTASKEAGDPYADICSGLVERLDIVVEEGDEVFLQLSGDNILVQLLHEHAALILIDFDDAVDLTVDVVSEHRLNSHVAAPFLYYIERPIIWIRRQLIKQFHIAAVKCAGIQHQHGHVRKIRLHGIQQGMDPDERECLSHAGDQYHVSRFMRLILHFPDEGRVVRHTLHLVQHELLSLFLLLLGNTVCDPLVIADGEEHFVKVILNQVAVQALVGHQHFGEMPDSHLILRIVAEDPDVYFIAQALALQKFRFLYQRPEVIQALHQIAHSTRSL